MHLCLLFERLHRISLERFTLILLLITTIYVASSVDSQFDVVAKRKLFIDRTLLIEHLFEKLRFLPWIVDHHVIIGPRKSGKSTNLSMMKQFFGVTAVNEPGKIRTPNTTKHHALFKSLKIGQRPFFKKYFARIPVIHVNLAEFVVNGSEKDFKKSFCKVIRDLITEHKYLLTSKAFAEIYIKDLKTYKDLDLCHKKDTMYLRGFGKKLARLIHNHFSTRVLVLIDELDAPAMSIIDSNTTINEHFITEVFNFVTRTIEENCEDVLASFLTGATTQGVFLGSMWAFDSYALQQDLKYFYAVSESEVRRLLSISGVKITKTLMNDLRKMYGDFGGVMYNTQSIIKFCERKTIKPYWTVAGGLTPFKKLLSSENEGYLVEEAMYKPLRLVRPHKILVQDLIDVKDFLAGKKEKPPNGWYSWSMGSYLWETGIFTHSLLGEQFQVPNNENRLILLDLVLNKEYYMVKHGVNEKLVNDFVMSVVHLNKSEISFNRLAECISHLFVRGAKNLNDEAVFRYPLYNYLRQADKGVFNKVTAELGQKTDKSDLIIKLKDGTNIFLGLSLDQESGQDALKQVLKDKQVQKFRKNKSKFVCLGINLLRLDSRCDISYLRGSADLKNVGRTRSYQSTCAEISRAKNGLPLSLKIVP